MGANWSLYAATASQVGSGLIQSGTVGEGNIITLNDVEPGLYRLVLTPIGGAPIDFTLDITPTTGYMVIQVNVPPTEVPTAPATTSPTSPAEQTPASTSEPTAVVTQPSSDPTATSAVSGLPDTGTGEFGVASTALITSAIITLVLMGAASLLRKSREA